MLCSVAFGEYYLVAFAFPVPVLAIRQGYYSLSLQSMKSLLVFGPPKMVLLCFVTVIVVFHFYHSRT